MQQVRLGYTASYPNDKDANFFFKPEIITKLKDKNLSARLSHNTQGLREVYIINPPQSTHEKLDEQICIEIEQRNKLNILYLEKFTSLITNKRYIKIILNSKEAKDSLAAKGTVYIYISIEITCPCQNSHSEQTRSPDCNYHRQQPRKLSPFTI